jgi:hypothetical protein
MKFSNYLTTIDGVSIYPIISLSLFVVFILLVFLYVLKMGKQEVEHDRNLPFDESISIKN